MLGDSELVKIMLRDGVAFNLLVSWYVTSIPPRLLKLAYHI